jgi:hypothetical protein
MEVGVLGRYSFRSHAEDALVAAQDSVMYIIKARIGDIPKRG